MKQMEGQRNKNDEALHYFIRTMFLYFYLENYVEENEKAITEKLVLKKNIMVQTKTFM